MAVEQSVTTPPDPGEAPVKLTEEQEQAAAKWLYDTLFEPAKQYRRKVVEDTEWAEFRQLYKNGTLENEVSPDADFEPFVGNIVMPTIDTIKGIALQTPSVIEFTPMEPGDEFHCAKLNAVIGDYTWGARNARFKLGQAFLEGAIVGTAWAKGFWNTRLLGGKGDLDFDIVVAEDVFVDPSCSGTNNWDYIIHTSRLPVTKAKYDPRFNDRRAELRADDAPTQEQATDTAEQDVDLVTIYEYWVKGLWLDALMAEVEGIASQVDDIGKKYGIVIQVGNEMVLNIKSHPFKSDRIPFARYVYYLPTGNQRIYGTGEVRTLKDPQLSVNARWTQLMQQAALIANNQWVVSNMLIVDEEEFTNESGKVIHVDGPVDGVKRIEPTSIGGSLLDAQQMLLNLADYISGMFHVNRGEQPGSLRAGVAIQMLQRGGEGRTYQKIVNFDQFVADLGLILADIMAAMYTEERVFRITGAAAADLEMMQQQMLAESLPPEMTPPGTGTPMGPKSLTGTFDVKLKSDDFKKEDGNPVDLDCRAQVGLMLRNAQEQMQYDVEMMEKGVFDAQYVIENNPVRNKARLLSRLQQVQQQTQMQQQMMAAPPEGEMPPDEEEMLPEVGAAEAQQIQQMVDGLSEQMRELEAQGIIPEGTADQFEDEVEQELAAGGTGEEAIAKYTAQIQTYLDQGASMTPPEVGVAGGGGAMMPM